MTTSASTTQAQDARPALQLLSLPHPGALQQAYVPMLLLIIAVFYALTLRHGNFWADDYALYVHHAKNLAEGRPYADTGYIYNPTAADYSPRAYPPVFPLLLTPIYHMFGLNLYAMKFESVLFFVLTLLVVSAWWKRALRTPYQLALVAIIGFSPIFWAFKDSVVADLPFLFFLYVTVWVVQSAPRQGHSWWKWAVLTGMLLALAMGTRTIGVTLFAGIFLYDVVKYRTPSRFSVLSTAVAVSLLLIERRVFGSGEQSYADQFQPTLSSILSNLRQYPHDFMMLWTRSLGFGFSITLFALTTALAIYGFIIHLRKGFSALDSMLLPYLTMVILWPAPQGIRFLLPIIPYYIYLMLLALQERPAHSRIAAVIFVMIALSYTAAFRHASYGTIRQADGSSSFNDLCRFIQRQTRPNDVLLFRRSRALSLFTSRPAAVYDLKHEERLAPYLATIHANYIVASPIFEEDRAVLIPFIHSRPNLLTRVYENSDFQVYRINDLALTDKPGVAVPDLTISSR